MIENSRPFTVRFKESAWKEFKALGGSIKLIGGTSLALT